MKNHRTRRLTGYHTLLIALALAFLAHPAFAVVTGFNDLQSWSGSGTNQSGLVIQWNDGKTPVTLAWGFHWNGVSTAYDMLTSVLNSNVGLYARVDSATAFGPCIFGLGYDSNQSGAFGVTGAQDTLGNTTTVTFTNGLSDMNTNPASVQAPFSSSGAEPSDSADHYKEGWFDGGFWELFTATGASYPGTLDWASSFIGATEPLVNNGWFAFSISNPDFSSNIPGPATAAVPEPSAFLLVLVGGGFLIHARRRFHLG